MLSKRSAGAPARRSNPDNGRQLARAGSRIFLPRTRISKRERALSFSLPASRTPCWLSVRGLEQALAARATRERAAAQRARGAATA